MNKEETVKKLGELVIDAYIRGTINQAEQVEMLNIINEFSLQDLIKNATNPRKAKTVDE